MTAKQFGMVGRKLTNDHDCYESTEYHKQLKGYTQDTRTIHSPIQRLQVVIPNEIEPLGREAFNRAFFEHSLTPATPIIMRVCPSCLVHIVRYGTYKRLTPIVNQEFDLLCHILYRRNDGNGDNVWNEDFHYIPLMKMQLPVRIHGNIPTMMMQCSTVSVLPRVIESGTNIVNGIPRSTSQCCLLY